MPPKWRTQYDEKRDALEGELAGKCCKGESLTQQQFTKEADINELVRRFGIDDQIVPPGALDPRYFGDVSDVPDLRTALDRVRNAEAAFMALPAELRLRFNNSAADLWDFVNNPKNDDEAVRLGLLKRAESPAGAGSPPGGTTGSPPNPIASPTGS